MLGYSMSKMFDYQIFFISNSIEFLLTTMKLCGIVHVNSIFIKAFLCV